MTAEQFHDALTQLPADLLAETDRKRSRTPKVIPWKRYAAMAACFVLVLCSGLLVRNMLGTGGASKMMSEAAIAETEAAAAPAAVEADILPDEAAPVEESASEDMQTNTTAGVLYVGMSQPQYLEAVPAETTACFSGNPSPELFRTRGELEAYSDKSPQRFVLDNLMEACAAYDDAWFETHDLLLISLCGVPVNDRSNVTAIREQDGLWEIVVENYHDSPEAERTDWHILIEVEKGLIANEDAVMVIYE